MKKVLFSLLVSGCLILSVDAAEKVDWPVWFAFNDTEDIDVVGLRVNLFSGNCEQVTGMDLGFIGRSRYYNGVQMNLLVNSVEDEMAGWQFSLGYNEIGYATLESGSEPQRSTIGIGQPGRLCLRSAGWTDQSCRGNIRLSDRAGQCDSRKSCTFYASDKL